MSLRDRLEQCSDEAELHAVMHDLWAFGSPNWTLDAARRFVRPALWNVLPRYFTSGGQLLPRFPDPLPGVAPTASEAPGLGADLSDPAGPREPHDEGETWAPAARRVRVSDVIAKFHVELAAMRAAVLERPPVAPPSAPGAMAPDEEPEEPSLLMVDTAEPFEEASEAAVEIEPEPDFTCVVCTKPQDGVPVLFQEKPLCLACAKEFGVR